MDVVRQTFAITSVFALLAVSLWLVKRRGALRIHGKTSNRPALESQGKLSLTAQHSIHLIRIGDCDMAIAVHPTGIILLTQLEPGLTKTPEGARTGQGAFNR
jgi:flagellar biogenesis protein FliO